MLHTTLPSPDETGSHKLTSLVRRQAGDRVGLQEAVKFWDKLGEVTERHEATLSGPRWTRAEVRIAVAVQQDSTWANRGCLTGKRVEVEALNRWVRDTVQKTEATRYIDSYTSLKAYGNVL